MLSLALANAIGTISEEEFQTTCHELTQIPQKTEKVLEQNDTVENLSSMFTYARNFLYLGRGYNYPVALEGALKLKEISYIHAEGYPAAEMKHGPPLVRAPVNSFEFHRCRRTPQVGCLTLSLGHSAHGPNSGHPSFTVRTTRVSNPVRYPHFRASASVTLR